MVPLLADRDLSARGVEVRVLRRPHPDAGRPGAARAAHRRAAVRGRPVVRRRTQAASPSLRPRSSCPRRTTAPLDVRVKLVTQRIADAFAAGIAEHPQDWHMLQKLWLTSRRAGVEVEAACGSGSSARTPSTCPGGVQNHILDLAEALIGLGHEVSVLAPADEDADLPPYVVPAGRAVPLPYNGSVARIAFGPVSTARVRRWLARGEFDVLHVHEPMTLEPVAAGRAVRARPGGGHLPHRDDPLPGAGRRRRACCSWCWRRSPPGSRSASWPARCRSSTSAAARWRSPTGWRWPSSPRAEPLPGWPGEGGALGFLGRFTEPRKGFPMLRTAFVTLARHAARAAAAGGRPGRPRRPVRRDPGRPARPGRRSSAWSPRRTRRGCCAASTSTWRRTPAASRSA